MAGQISNLLIDDLWRKANGMDETPVIPFAEQKSLSTEHTFEQDTIDTNFIHAELLCMTAWHSTCASKTDSRPIVKIRYPDFMIYTKQVTIPYTNSDHILMHVTNELFKKLYERRILIRLIGIRFTNMIPGNYQIRLFDDTEEMIKLYKAIDSVKRQFWEGLVMKAGGM